MGFWSNLIFREIREVVAPVSKEGIHLFCGESYTSAEDFEEGERPEEYTPSTIIIHGDTILGGCAKWELEVPEYIRNRLIDITLRIDAIRTHAVLHSPIQWTSAVILVNDELVDLIYLVQRLPHGLDFGVDSRRPISVFRYIDGENDTQTITLGVEKDVLWDVDRVTLVPLILRKEIRTEVAMIIGAIISAIIGALVGFYL